MAIPDYQTIMLPLLKLTADGREWQFKDATQAIIKLFNLTEEEIAEPLPSRTQPVIANRVGWARTYLAKAGLLTQTRRGYFTITEIGKKVLSESPTAITVKYLSQFPEFNKFRTVQNKDSNATSIPTEQSEIEVKTPEELLEQSHDHLRGRLADELLESILTCSPVFFERLVLDLLIAMGYGGTLKDAAQTTKRSGDDGIDGIVKEDKLGLDTIYIQAKRWARDRNVGRPDVQQFAGSLQGNRARKGIFVTTSDFSQEARAFVERVESKIILINGGELATLMIDHGVGVSLVRSFHTYRIDSDYFSE